MNNEAILITGASRGIGAATARLAAAKGYTICLNYRANETAAREVAASIESAGGTAFILQADVSNEKEVKSMFSKIDSHGLVLRGLVNNAGILEKQMRVTDMDVERINRIMRTNVLSLFLCSKEAIARMSTRNGGRGGSIVNVSSIAARTGSPGEYVDYAASKGATDSFTIGLAKEVAEDGIRVNAVRPAFIYTDIHASGGEPGRVDRVKERVPLKRGGTTEEVAEAIVWLLLDNSSYTTGSFIDVTGGA